MHFPRELKPLLGGVALSLLAAPALAAHGDSHDDAECDAEGHSSRPARIRHAPLDHVTDARQELTVVLPVRLRGTPEWAEGPFPFELGSRRTDAATRSRMRSLSGPVPDDLEHETKLLPGRVRPYAELLALVDGWNAMDDDRCAFLQDAVPKALRMRSS